MANDLLSTQPKTAAEMDLLFRIRVLAKKADEAVRPDVAAKLAEAVKLIEGER